MPDVPHEFKFVSYSTEPQDMSSVCSCCTESIKDAIHVCKAFVVKSNYDFHLCQDEFIITDNLTMSDADLSLFFHTVHKLCNPSLSRGGKNMFALKTSAFHGLTEMMNTFIKWWDAHRPSGESICANKIRMYLSRINKVYESVTMTKTT